MSKRVLVLEDDYMTGTHIADVLEDAGYVSIGPVRNVREAQRILEFEPLDAAVLDISLDSETSLPLANRILSRGLPVLFVTAYAQQLLSSEWTRVPHLDKPFTRPQLLEHVAALFERASPPAARLSV
jgi:DNA-binding response OmpR family regulator